MRIITFNQVKRYFTEFPSQLEELVQWLEVHQARQRERAAERERIAKIYDRQYVWKLSEVAALFGVHRKTVLNHMKRLGIERRLPNNQVVFLWEDIKALAPSFEKGRHG